mgnify:CR=1 FL=1
MTTEQVDRDETTENFIETVEEAKQHHHPTVDDAVSGYVEDIEKEDGSSSGSDINETVTYLNDEFNKSEPSGTSEFSGILTTQVVSDNRIKAEDTIIVMPVTNILIKEALVVTNVINGAFTVIRFTIGSGSHVLTTALPFRWKVL